MLLSRLTTAPAFEPVTLLEAKAHLRIESSNTDDDVLVAALITAARQYAEEHCWRGILTQTREVTLPAFPDCDSVRLPFGQLQSITSVTYVDDDGDTQTLAASEYEADTVSEPGKLRLAYDKDWPSTREQWNAVVIAYVVGWQHRRRFEQSANYQVGEYVIPSAGSENGHYYKVTTAGTSAAAEPSWPTDNGGTVTSGDVTFTEQGARDPSVEVPGPVKQAVLLLISQMYEHRVPEIAGTIVSPVKFAVDALLAPYRLTRF